MCAGVQRTRSREVFGGWQVECMGAVYSHADKKIIFADAWRVHGRVVRARRTESYRRRYNLEACGKRVCESVNVRDGLSGS